MLKKKTEEVIQTNEVDTNEDFSAVETQKPEAPKKDEWNLALVKTPDGMPLNLRSDPDKRGTALTQIPNGTAISVKDFDTKWVAAKYNNFQGFCMKEFIKF